MRVLLDENLPHDLRHHIAGFEVATVAFLGWQGTSNGELLRRAAAAGIGALVTKDSGLQYEQSLSELPLTVVILRARTNALEDILPLVPLLLAALGSAPPRSLVRLP